MRAVAVLVYGADFGAKLCSYHVYRYLFWAVSESSPLKTFALVINKKIQL